MMMMNIQNPMLKLEIRVLSCQGLNLINKAPSSSSSSFSLWSLFMSPNSKPTTTRHFISIAKLPDKKPKVYSGRLEEEGEGAGEGGVLCVPSDSSFFSNTQSCLRLQIYRKRRILGPRLVGWCLIPTPDISPLAPPCVRYLSYRLRGRDGCRVGAIVNLCIKLKLKDDTDTCGGAAPVAAIGIPIGAMQEGHVKSGLVDEINDWI